MISLQMFFKNLRYIFNNKELRKRWGTYTIKLSLWVGETLKEIINIIIEIKKKYKING